MGEVAIELVDPSSPPAVEMADALWVEIQRRYGFEAPDNPMERAAMVGPLGGFWLATDDGQPVGNVALVPREGYAELDAVYVAPTHRRAGVGRALIAALEAHASATGQTTLRLRAGDPQPEALDFYQRLGYVEIAAFDHWAGDPTARCFEKRLASPR